MINKGSTFYFKLYIKNILTLFVMLCVCLFSYLHRYNLEISISKYVSYNSYSLIVVTIAIALMSTYISGENFESFDYLEKSLFKKYLSIIVAGIKYCTVMFLPMIIIIILNLKKIQISSYQIKGLIHMVLLWYTAALFSASIGTLLGLIIKKPIRYIIIFIIVAPFVLIFDNDIVISYIRIIDDKVGVVKNPVADILLNTNYFLDKLFIIILVLAMLLSIYEICNKKRFKSIIAIIITLLMIESVIVWKGFNSRTIINNDRTEIASKNISEYIIDKYTMNINISNKINNSCIIDISEYSSNGNIELGLDKIFKIKYIKVNEMKAKYSRENNILKINITDLNIDKSNNLKLEIVYSGNIYGISDIGVDTIYVGRKATSLLDEAIFWYPKPLNNNEIQYKLNINSKATIYSNLSSSNEANDGYTQKLEGKSNSVNLLSGNYKYFKINDVELILPLAYNEEFVYSQAIEMLKAMELEKEDKEKVINGEINKIIITPFNNIYPIVDNTALCGFFID